MIDFNIFGLVMFLVGALLLYLFIGTGLYIVGWRFNKWFNKGFLLFVLLGVFFSFTTGYSGPKLILDDESGFSTEIESSIKNLRDSGLTDQERLELNQEIYNENLGLDPGPSNGSSGGARVPSY